MNLTQTTVKNLPCNKTPDHPYVLYLEDYGSIGDKFNMGDSSTGIRFPSKTSSRFRTRKRAEVILKAFLRYVNAKISDAKAGIRSDTESDTKERKLKPSYFLWN